MTTEEFRNWWRITSGAKTDSSCGKYYTVLAKDNFFLMYNDGGRYGIIGVRTPDNYILMNTSHGGSHSSRQTERTWHVDLSKIDKCEDIRNIKVIDHGLNCLLLKCERNWIHSAKAGSPGIQSAHDYIKWLYETSADISSRDYYLTNIPCQTLVDFKDYFISQYPEGTLFKQGFALIPVPRDQLPDMEIDKSIWEKAINRPSIMCFDIPNSLLEKSIYNQSVELTSSARWPLKNKLPEVENYLNAVKEHNLAVEHIGLRKYCNLPFKPFAVEDRWRDCNAGTMYIKGPLDGVPTTEWYRIEEMYEEIEEEKYGSA